MSTKPSSRRLLNTGSNSIDGIGVQHTRSSCSSSVAATTTPSIVVLRRRSSITGPKATQRGTTTDIDNPVKDTTNSNILNDKVKHTNQDFAYIDVNRIPSNASTVSLRIASSSSSSDDDDETIDNNDDNDIGAIPSLTECRATTTVSGLTSHGAKGQTEPDEVRSLIVILQEDQQEQLVKSASSKRQQVVAAVDRDANDYNNDLLAAVGAACDDDDNDDYSNDNDDGDAMAADDISLGEHQPRSLEWQRPTTTTTTTASSTSQLSRTPASCQIGMFTQYYRGMGMDTFI